MLEQFASVNIWMLTLVMTRLGTMLSLVPGFGASYVLPRYRLSLALVMSFMLLPVVSKYIPPMPRLWLAPSWPRLQLSLSRRYRQQAR